MSEQEQEQEPHYLVVVNAEEQYSIWLLSRELPLGWREAGFQGERVACLAWIDKVWVDMRPASLRMALAAQDQ